MHIYFLFPKLVLKEVQKTEFETNIHSLSITNHTRFLI